MGRLGFCIARRRGDHFRGNLRSNPNGQAAIAIAIGEQLGMLAIYILLLTAEEHYEILSNANIFCDNLGTIHTFSAKYARVSSSAENSDILRVLRKIQSLSKLAHKLSHVKVHQDDRG